jgi:hypothetical protein
MATESGADVHHDAPRCLLGLFDAPATGLADWSVFDADQELYPPDPYHQAQLGRLEDELRHGRGDVLPSRAGERMLTITRALPLTEVLEYSPYEDGSASSLLRL